MWVKTVKLALAQLLFLTLFCWVEQVGKISGAGFEQMNKPTDGGTAKL
jgi:hypothetical protein